MQAATSIWSYFDKITELMMDLRNHCPRFSEYEKLFANSNRLQAALCSYFALVINLCQRVIEVIQRPGKFEHSAGQDDTLV